MNHTTLVTLCFLFNFFKFRLLKKVTSAIKKWTVVRFSEVVKVLLDRCLVILNCLCVSPSVKPLPLSPLDPQSSVLIGAAGEHQDLELRLRDVEEHNHALRREISLSPRVPTHSSHHSNSHQGNQLHTHSTEEGTGDSEAKKGAASGNSSDCVPQPVVNKCEVSMLKQDFTLTDSHIIKTLTLTHPQIPRIICFVEERCDET